MKAPSRRSGFTVMEIAVAVAIIAILAAIAIPAFLHTAKRSRIGIQDNDLRSFDHAFTNFELKNEFLPPSHSAVGTFPTGMSGYMPAAWNEPAAIGGVYSWIHSSGATPEDSIAYIRITGAPGNPIALTSDELVKLDRLIDDGNTGTGQLVLSAGPSIRYYIRQ